eukprot:187459-Chlamydomonas_euryale.AAC.1
MAQSEAAECFHSEAMRLLLKWPEDPVRLDDQEGDALERAAGNGRIEVVRLHFEHVVMAD